MNPALLHCRIDREGEVLSLETAAYECGLRVLTLATTSAELLMQLVGTYTGDDRLSAALVSEAIELPDFDAPKLCSRDLPVPPGFSTLHRDVAVGDHLESFCEQAATAYGQRFQLIERPSFDALTLA